MRCREVAELPERNPRRQPPPSPCRPHLEEVERQLSAHGFLNHSEFGDAVGWGTGEQDALARQARIDREYLEYIRSKGVGIELVRSWRRLYECEGDRSLAKPRIAFNATATARATLMRLIE